VAFSAIAGAPALLEERAQLMRTAARCSSQAVCTKQLTPTPGLPICWASGCH